MRKVLVAGGAGFIGSHLVDVLVASGISVRVLDDFSSGSRRNLEQAVATGAVEIVEGSVLDRGAVSSAMDGCDAVFNLAVRCVRASIERPIENHDVNATGTLYLLEEARRRSVHRFVYCSTSEIYGNAGSAKLGETALPAPVTVYGGAKLAGEHYALAYHQTYGLPTTVVRPFNAYGPREHETGVLAEVIPRFVIRVLNGLPPVIFGDGSNGRDFTFVGETARGIAMAASCDALVGRAVNIAYGKMVSIRTLAEAVCRQCGRPDLSPVHIAPRPGDVRHLEADTDLAKRTLGFVAKVGLEEGLAAYIDWFRRVHPDIAALRDDQIENWKMPAGRSTSSEFAGNAAP